MPTPDGKPTLSEWLLEWADDYGPGCEEYYARFREASAKLARIEAAEQQPEVAELLARAKDLEAHADYCEQPCSPGEVQAVRAHAESIRAHAAALVALAQAEKDRDQYRRGFETSECTVAARDEELAFAKDARDEALARVGRVEGLPEKWRASQAAIKEALPTPRAKLEHPSTDAAADLLGELADELTAALRGETGGSDADA